MRCLALIASLCACGDNGSRSADAYIAGSGDAQRASCIPSHGTKLAWRFIAATNGPAMIVTSPPNDPRLFVVEQQGKIRIITDDSQSPSSAPFLDLSDQIVSGGEQGLLGLAFDPQYALDHTFYVFYTTADANVLARYTASTTDPDKADPTSGVVMLSIPDFATNHNGGMLDFGPDGDLYITTGDGGGGGDPHLNGQNTHALLAKMLRIGTHHEDVGLHYSIPTDNPFADGVAGAPEVLHYGFRNAWRWAFDRMTGDLWIGDVGQDAIEELDLVPAGAPFGQNFGWSLYEGPSCYNNGNGNGTCSPAGIAMPQFEAAHTDGWCAIIGGDVYRGQCFPDLAGTYFFTDYCKHELHTATKTGPASFDVSVPDVTTVDASSTYAGSPVTPASIHAAANGEIYMTTTSCCGSSATGGIYRLEASP
ncbi:MAG TPA: PQQ-dependent sugar dehydrogenase [Kofleriaceae bacterium]